MKRLSAPAAASGLALTPYVTTAAPPAPILIATGPVAGFAFPLGGEVQMAIVQSDIVADAVAGVGSFAGSLPFAELRSIGGFCPEALTVHVRAGGPVKAARRA